MAQVNVPAVLQSGHKRTKKQLEEMAEMEASLKGSDDLVFSTPLHLNDMAKVYYGFLVEELREANILSNIDIPLLEQTADCLSKMRTCDKEIEEYGVFITEIDRYGQKKRVENVAVKTKLNLMTKYGQLAAMLGLSPSARAALSAKKVEANETANDPLIQLLSRRNG